MNTAIIDGRNGPRFKRLPNSECTVQANFGGRTVDVWQTLAQSSLACPSLSFDTMGKTVKPNLTPDSNEILKEYSDQVL